jgi:hypothetical protein
MGTLFNRYALAMGTASAMLAGCGVLRQAEDDTQPPIGAPGAMPQSHALPSPYRVLFDFRGRNGAYPQRVLRALHYYREPSWLQLENRPIAIRTAGKRCAVQDARSLQQRCRIRVATVGFVKAQDNALGEF